MSVFLVCLFAPVTSVPVVPWRLLFALSAAGTYVWFTWTASALTLTDGVMKRRLHGVFWLALRPSVSNFSFDCSSVASPMSYHVHDRSSNFAAGECKCPFGYCLSPGPTYSGPPVDRDGWPLRGCPDWPMNTDWLEFAFAHVVYRNPLSGDIEPFDLDSAPY